MNNSTTNVNKIKVTKILDDICEITTIPPASMHKLFDKIGWCVCNSVYESKLANDTYCECNIGLGNLIISMQDNMLQYKFIPSMKFENELVATLKTGKNPLEIKLEETFVNRILKTYKDML